VVSKYQQLPFWHIKPCNRYTARRSLVCFLKYYLHADSGLDQPCSSVFLESSNHVPARILGFHILKDLSSFLSRAIFAQLFTVKTCD
jgi:hypothetical protein